MANQFTTFLTDAYKLHHAEQYPKNTEYVYSNLVARNFKFAHQSKDGKMVVYGLKYVLKELEEEWKVNFFDRHWDDIEDALMEFSTYTGIDIWPLSNKFFELYDLGRMPLDIRYVEDYTLVEENTAILTIMNTLPEFYWLPNFLETYLNAESWQLITSANIARNYYDICEEYASKTCDNQEHIFWQCHDFSYRGMSSTSSAIKSGLGHLAYFKGTDNIPALQENINKKEILGNHSDFKGHCYHKEDPVIIGSSIPATEHSVMCAGGKETELETYKRLIELYPSGILSVVSDTWDYFNVLTNILPKLKDDILARDGKFVVRPDSGDPQEMVMKSLPILGDLFGYTLNDKGYKLLNPKIGLIYGDSITLERCESILNAMEKERWASSNVVFGVGSYTYQYNTRDSYGFAFKATAVRVNGKWENIFKQPKTDQAKASRKGFTVFDGKKTIDDLTFDEYQKAINSPLSLKIKELRELANLTYIDVAEELGINERDYLTLEQQPLQFHLSQLEILSNLLKTNLDDLLKNKNTNNTLIDRMCVFNLT